MKLIKFLLLITCLLISAKSFGAHQLYADIEGVKIPYGTKLDLTLAENITTRTLGQGDMFQAYLSKDLYVNNKLILPAKTIFRGRIKEVKPSKRLSRPASIYLSLDHLVTKKGTQLPLDAGIASNFGYVIKNDGAITTGGNYFSAVKNDAKNSTKLVSNAINWGKSTGENAQYVFVPIGALGGAIGCVGVSAYSVVADLIEKGDEVVIKKGSEFEIMLLSTLEIPN